MTDVESTVNGYMPPLSILVFGQLHREEFASVATDLAAERLAVVQTWRGVASLDEREFDAIVICQSFPGEFVPAMLDQLRSVMPLVPVIVVLGAWCEGEERTGSAPLRGVARVTATQWLGWGCRELEMLRRGACSRSMLPATSGNDERSLVEALPRITSPISVSIYRDAVLGVDHAMTTMLTEFLTTQGFAVVESPNCSDWTLVDLADVAGERRQEVVAPLAQESRVVALMHSPRSDEIAAMLRIGVAAVFPKPLNMFSLQYFLETGH